MISSENYYSDFDVRNLECLNLVGVKVRPELCAALLGISRCRDILRTTAGNHGRPPRDSLAVLAGRSELGQIEVDVLRGAPVDRHDDKLRLGGIIGSNDMVRATVEDAHAVTDVAGELSEGVVLLLDVAECDGVVVAVDETPATAVDRLPVDPSGRVQPAEVEDEVRDQLRARGVVLAVLAVPDLLACVGGSCVQAASVTAAFLVAVDVDAADLADGA